MDNVIVDGIEGSNKIGDFLDPQTLDDSLPLQSSDTMAKVQEIVENNDVEMQEESAQKEEAKVEFHKEEDQKNIVDETPRFLEDCQKFEKEKDEEMKQENSIEKKAALLAKQAKAKAKEEENAKRNLVSFEKAKELKREGNEFFKNKEYGKARGKYARVFAFTRSIVNTQSEGQDGIASMVTKSKGKVSEELEKEVRNLERDVNLNLAQVYIVEKNWPKVVVKATYSLNIEETAKAYFRRGKAYAMKNDYENAYKDLNKGLETFKDDADLFKGEIAKTKKREQQFDKAESKRISQAFSKN